jgi:hypothetical protein
VQYLPSVGPKDLVWSYIGWRQFGSPTYSAELPNWLQWPLWMKQVWPYANQSIYGRGNLLKYVALLPAVVSPLIFPAMCTGIWRNLGARDDDAHRQRCRQLIAIIPLLILLGHSVLHFLGKLASSGEMRYMLIVAPFWALLSASGWQWIWQRMNWKNAVLAAGVASLAPAIINVRIPIAGRVIGYNSIPLRLDEASQRARRFANWYRTWPLREREYPRLLAANRAIHYFLDISPTDPRFTRDTTREMVLSAKPGTLLVWDSVYSHFNSDAARSITLDDVRSAGWVLDEEATLRINEVDHLDLSNKSHWSIWRSPRASR